MVFKVKNKGMLSTVIEKEKFEKRTKTFYTQGVQSAARGPHAAEDGCDCDPMQDRKFTENTMRFCVITCCSVWPKTTLLLLVWPRDSESLDAPATAFSVDLGQEGTEVKGGCLALAHQTQGARGSLTLPGGGSGEGYGVRCSLQ